MAQAGHPNEEIAEVLLNRGSNLGKANGLKWAAKGQAEGYVDLTASRAVAIVQGRNLVRRLCRLEAKALSDERQSAAGKATIAALVAIARRTGKLEFTASVRELAAMSGCAVGTIHRQLVTKLGAYLERTQAGTDLLGATYRLRGVPPAADGGSLFFSGHSVILTRGREYLRDLGGHVALAALHRLHDCPEGLSTSELSKQLGTPKRTLSRHLSRLVERGLVCRRGWRYSFERWPPIGAAAHFAAADTERVQKLRDEVDGHRTRVSEWNRKEREKRNTQ